MDVGAQAVSGRGVWKLVGGAPAHVEAVGHVGGRVPPGGRRAPAAGTAATMLLGRGPPPHRLCPVGLVSRPTF